MKVTKCICLTCGKEFDSRRAHTKYCSRICYRRNPEVKERYLESTRAYHRRHHKEVDYRYKKMISICNTKKREVSLTIEQYRELINSGCYYCNKTLLDENGISLDRIDNKGGYTEQNVKPCCGKCNQIKNVHLTVEEMVVAMKAVLKLRDLI